MKPELLHPEVTRNMPKQIPVAHGAKNGGNPVRPPLSGLLHICKAEMGGAVNQIQTLPGICSNLARELSIEGRNESVSKHAYY